MQQLIGELNANKATALQTTATISSLETISNKIEKLQGFCRKKDGSNFSNLLIFKLNHFKNLINNSENL